MCGSQSLVRTFRRERQRIVIFIPFRSIFFSSDQIISIWILFFCKEVFRRKGGKGFQREEGKGRVAQVKSQPREMASPNVWPAFIFTPTGRPRPLVRLQKHKRTAQVGVWKHAYGRADCDWTL